MGVMGEDWASGCERFTQRRREGEGGRRRKRENWVIWERGGKRESTRAEGEGDLRDDGRKWTDKI